MSEKDIVKTARVMLAESSRIHALNDADPKKDEDVGWLLSALADEVERQRTALTKLRDSTSDMWACSFAGEILKAVSIDEALDHAKKYDED